MYKKEEFFEKIRNHVKEDDHPLVRSLVEEIETVNEKLKDEGEIYELFIDFYDVDEISEFNPFLTYSLRIKPVDDNQDKPAVAYESLVGEMNLRELDNVVCAISSLIEEKENIESVRPNSKLTKQQALQLFKKDLRQSESAKDFLEHNSNLLKVVEDNRKQNRISFILFDGDVVSQDINKFTEQSLEGQLYDINRSEEMIKSFKDSDWSKYTQRWLNDLALVQLLEFYYNKCKSLEGEISVLNDRIITNEIIGKK